MDKHLKIIKKFLKEIEPTSIYDSKDLIKKGIIVNTKLEPSFFTLYRLIKKGQIKAINVGTGTQARYVINGNSLKEFLLERYKNLI